MITSDTIKSIAPALIEFHKAVGKIGKDATNPFFNKSYCSLPNILETIMPHLNNAGLSIIQFPEGANELTTRLIHSTGEWMQATYTMPVAKQNDPQALGSAISYQRRYSIMSVLCLTIADDDDGNLATHGAATPQQAAAKATKTIDQNGEKPWLDKNSKKYDLVVERLKNGETTISKVAEFFKLNKDVRADLQQYEKKP